MKGQFLSDFKSLNRNEMKNIMGGKAGDCSMTYQDSSGNWHTENGSCALAVAGTTISGATIYQPYCSTQSFTGPVSLSSNGGTSRCGSPNTFLGMLFS